MSKLIDDSPDYQKILNYENKINIILHHHLKKYRYVGEDGKEYEVIQGIFSQLNHLNELTNKQIRWYAVIINLWMSFQQRRNSFENRGIKPGPDFSLLENIEGFKVSTGESGARKGPGVATEWGKFYVNELKIPPYIPLIERFINQSARLGMLIATKETISHYYINYILKEIHSLLSNLLKDMESKITGETWEEVYILTIKNAAENTIKLVSSEMESRESFAQLLGSVQFKKLIIMRVREINQERLSTYNNPDAFWNGFIP